MSESFVRQTIEKYTTKTPGIALDIGANHGSYTTMLAERFEHVHAFEPEPSNFQILQKTVEPYDNVTCHQMAVGIENGNMNLFISTNKGGHSISEDVGFSNKWGHSSNRTIEVESRTLDNITSGMENIVFIKCDIEAGENFIFMHAPNTFRKNDITMMLETHATIDGKALANLFHSYGYQCLDAKNNRCGALEINTHYKVIKA